MDKSSIGLNSLRQKLDKIDDELIRLFEQRMEVTEEIARFKLVHNLPVYDPAREQQKIQELSQKVKKGREANVSALYSLLFKLSRAEQEQIINKEQAKKEE
ncbi:MAG: chorismate mutase [Treponema sp.]|nr:chorismate mutase [Treponema sp.]